MNVNGHQLKPPPHFFEFKLAHLLTIIMILGFSVSWWLKHEKAASDADTHQTMMLASHEKRFEQIERRMETYEKVQIEVVPDIREMKGKLNVIVELIDGEHKKPELHK